MAAFYSKDSGGKSRMDAWPDEWPNEWPMTGGFNFAIRAATEKVNVTKAAQIERKSVAPARTAGGPARLAR